MRRISFIVGLALVAIVAWLGVAVWRQRAERDLWARKVAAATQAVVKQRQAAVLDAHGQDRQPVRPLPTATAPAKTPAELEAGRLGRALVERQERMNALNGYHAGFIALKLPAPIVARAKEIILAGWGDAAEVRKRSKSPAEMAAGSIAAGDAVDAQLQALLGQHTYDELKAYQQESHFDWTIGTDLWDAGVPLSSEQLHGLCLAIAQTNYKESNRTFQPTEQMIPDPVTGLSPQDDALLAASAPVLSPGQLQALRQNLADDNRYNAAMREFGARQRQLWQKAAGGK